MAQMNPAFSNKKTLIFMLLLSFVCAFVLSVLASALSPKKEEAKQLDRDKEMLVAAKIYDRDRHCFLVAVGGKYLPARYEGKGRLVPSDKIVEPTTSEVLAVVHSRTKPILVNDQGKTSTFEEAHIDEKTYIAEHKKAGYAKLPWKLIYELYSNPEAHGSASGQPPIDGYIIPVSGFGLWDYIYGYIAIRPDGDTVIGISWYEQKETPGLGANIADTPWQGQFTGKEIFQPDSQGNIDFHRGSLGITVVRGKVKEVIGDVPKAVNFVDGIAGATLTGNGVTKAYKDTLGPYRPFLVRIHNERKNR